MVSSGLLRRVALVGTDVSEELSASFIRVTRIGELRTKLAVTSVVPRSSIVILMKEVLSSYEKSVLTRATQRNTPDDTILLQKMFQSPLPQRHLYWVDSACWRKSK
jgi:predicted polyphosphate/ATP-dependent NAD kinase